MGAENALLRDQSIDPWAADLARFQTLFGRAFFALRAILRTPTDLVTAPAPPTDSRPHSRNATLTLTVLCLGPNPWSDIVTTYPSEPAHARSSPIITSISSKKLHARS